ncbi:Bug family tripartite tricarboxylate transporter substrate binding protein [Hydrogenophaga sp. OTU3427]|uniref:Bug family tripartite tricarboxylate transporter substrate binding protein n=1 Tax=Hydrogenophaga sp. OTU3427 TaxID=3043856 RepID=UPI00313F35C0
MNKINRRHLLAGAAVLGLALPALAQTYPAKPVRVVLPYSAGSGPDAVVRHVGEKLSKEWGQSIVVDNKPGANGWLAIGDVKRASPDGYNLLTVDATHMTLQPHLYKQLPFVPESDFELVAPLYFTNFFVVVGANSPWKSMADLLAAAKAKSGEVTYGSWGLGSVAHVGTAMLERATGANMRHVPFKELPQLYTSVATGEVDWAFGTAATVGPLYQAKKVRLLAYAGARRVAGYQDVPTVAEAGGPAAFELSTWVAMYAPKGTSKAIAERLYASSQKALAEADVKSRLATVGFEAWTATPAEAVKVAARDKARYAEVVKQANISLD